MIQSCDCRLPAMIEPLHSPQQHKSMSITSPEHIRHFPFLLVISMAHPTPSSQRSFCTQTTKPGNEMISLLKFKHIPAHRIIRFVWHRIQTVQQLTLSLCSHVHYFSITINYRWPCHHSESAAVKMNWNEHMSRLTLDGARVCLSIYACMPEHIGLCNA